MDELPRGEVQQAFERLRAACIVLLLAIFGPTLERICDAIERVVAEEGGRR